MKVPGDFSELVAGTPVEATAQSAAPTFDAPEQSEDGGDFRARISKAADHISDQVARYADVDGFNQDVREVRALNELGKLTQTERQAAAIEDPAAKAEQDAYANLDKMDWRESDLILDKAAGSPSLMDTYTPPPGARPMDSEKAQEIAQSTLQKFGLVDQAQVDASKERKLMDAVDATGLPRELLESGDPSATVRNFREQGGAVETFAKMHPVTAGFVNEFANLVRPDWQELSWPEQIGRNFMAGTMQGQAQVKLAMVMDRVRSQGMTPELMAEAWQYDKDIKNSSGLPMDDWANKIAGNSAQQLPQFAYGATEAAKYAAAGLAMGVAGEVATGGALAVPMLAWGAKVGYAEFTRKLEGGLALWELLNLKDPAGNHLPYKAAAIGSDIVGGINAAIELWELDTIAKTIPGVRKVMADVGKEAALKTLLSPSFRQVLFQGAKAFAGFEAKEIGQEMLQELTQVASEEINKAYANKTGASFGSSTMAEIRDRLYDIGEKTFWGMIPFGGPGVAWTTAKDAVQTPQARKLLDPFMAKIGADKLAQESPSVFERLIERNVQAGAFPGKVYMPSADVRALFQDKTSGAVDVEGLRAFLSEAGIDRQVFLDSLDHSADVSMDSKRLARVLATDAGAALHSLGNLTFSPGEREVARAEAQVEQAKATGDTERIAQAQAALKEVESGISEQDRATLDSLFQGKVDLGRIFKERIVSDMVSAGHTKAQARVAASLIDGNAQVWAENTGQTVEAYYKKYGYRIKKTNFGGILAQIYQAEYATNFKSEAGFFERFNRDEGFRQEVLAKVNLGAPAEAAQVVPPVALAPQQTQAPVATAAVTVPTATSSSQAAGASPAASVEVGPTHEVVRIAEDQALEAQRWAALEGFQAAGWTAETRMDRPMFTKDGLEVWPSGFGQDVGVVVVKVAGAPTWSGSLNRTVRMETEETAADFAARVEAEGRAMLPAPTLSPEVAAIVARGEVLARQVLPGETVDAAKAALAQAGPTVEQVLQDVGVVGPQGPVQMLFQDRAVDQRGLTLVERTENGATFRTGQPVTFDYVHNPQSATALYGKPEKDAPFGRGLEPSGRYLNLTKDADKAPAHLESGTLTLQNPLVIDNAGLAWKQELSQAFGGLTGKKLSLALLAEGYDGVVTVDNPGGRLEHVSEILDLTTFEEAKALYQDSGPRPPQGASVFSNDNQAVIHFFEGKDVSTAPHEIFHVFRRVLQDMAMHPSANAQVRADWAGACEFVGAQVGQKWTRDQEEKWADAALTYLMEGKAPSQNLKGAFSRMADWLLAVYRSVRNMVSLSPQIRGVFDRLLATQDEIRAAEDRLQTVPLFTEKRSVDYEAALAELKQATEEEVRAYRVGKLNSLRKLWAKDGKAIADNAEHQKKIDALVEAGGVRVPDSELSSGNCASIKRHRPGKLLIGPDAAMSEHEAADMVGVPRLAFWAWLSAAQTKSAIVKEHVAAQERMFNDEFDVDEVMLSERLEKVLELEAKTLAEALGGRSVPASALKAWVREKTGQTKADQALVGEFDALKEVLRRESMASRKAFREGKNKEALQAKERQRAALAELRTRIKDQKTALTIQARAVRISEAVLNKNSKVDWDWGEQVLRLVVHFGLNEKRKSIFPRQADTMPGLLQFIQAKDADGYETHNGNIPEWIYAEGQGQLGRQNPNHWKNLSMAQLREVDTALRYLYEAGKRERLYVTDGKEIELVTVADKLIRSMDGLKNVRRLADYQKSQPLGWLLNKKRQYIAEITNPEYLWDAVDGFEAEGARGKRTGPAWQYVRMALMQARSAELREYGRVAAAMDEIFHPMRERNVRERFTLEGVPLMSEVAEEWGGLWNYERLVSAALNMGNAGNLHALSAGFGWTQDHLALIAKQLTAAEWRMVQEVWDLVETLWPAVDQTFYALHGQHMQKVEALPLTVQTKDGQEITLRGGYYPLIGDHRLNDKAGQFAEADLMKNETMALFTPAKVKDSFTLKRTGMVLPPRLSLSVMSRHVQQAVHYATHGVQVRNLQRIITLPEFSEAFKAKFGEDQYRMLTPWLKNIARPDSPQLGFFEQTLEKWRTLGTISALGLNAQVAFLQVSSLPQSAQSIGWDYLAKAYSAMANPQNTATLVAFVRENSPLMRDRFHDMDRDMARNAKKFNPTDRKLQFQVGEQRIELGMQEFHEFAMLPIAFSDCLVTYPTWLAAFMKGQADNSRDIAKGLPGKPLEELCRMADEQVIRAQAGGSAMNLSALQHGAGWRRLITMFASFTMNYQNRLRHYARGVGEGKISKVDYARHLFNETLLPVVLTSIMLKLLKDNELPDTKDLAWNFGGYLLSGFPIFRGMPRIMQYGMGGVMDSAAWRGVDLAAKSGQQLIKAATDQGKRSEHLLAFIKDATDMAGFAAGVPTVPIWRFAKGVHDLAAGSEKNPFRPFFSPSPDSKKK